MWQYELCHSSAKLTGYISEWAVLEDQCKNQRFNAQDGSPLSWDRFFSELVRWYGVARGVVGPELDEPKFREITLAGGADCPLGYGPPVSIRLSRSFKDWAQDDANRRSWRTIMEKSAGEVNVDVFEAGIDTEMADFLVYKIGVPSVAKLRRFGFNGFVDTMESVFEIYQEMAQMGVLVAPRVESANPMI